jgi:transaldolase
MTPNPLQQLLGLGQSVWLDELTRDWLGSGQLAQFMERDAVRGVTSNPSIFQKAIAGSQQYDAQLGELARAGADAEAIYDALTLDDIRGACDLFLPLHASSGGLDGYVSHEVSPRLAADTWGTVNEARRLWAAVDRPNLMIKIPATAEGMPAVRECLVSGINVNVTLMFSLAHYDAVAEAYLDGLETRAAAGRPLEGIASVASFFVSRVDSHVDALLAARLAEEGDPQRAGRMRDLMGKAAVANAKRAFRRYQQLFSSRRFAALQARGARRQRVLWASTSTKNPAYSDVLYVDELVGPHTVNTLPLETLDAFRDHGRVAPALLEGLDEADGVVRQLALWGIDLDKVGERLSVEGVDKFVQSLDGVLATVEERRQQFAPA